MDGELLWKEPRRDDLYVACASQGKVLLVGRRHVRALELHKISKEKLDERPDQTLEEAPVAEFPSGPEEEKREDDDFPRPARAWEGRTLEFPQGSAPSGMGFLSAGLYYVPLSSGGGDGHRPGQRSRGGKSKSRQGNMPGNLVSHEGRILSQDATGLEALRPIDGVENSGRRAPGHRKRRRRIALSRADFFCCNPAYNLRRSTLDGQNVVDLFETASMSSIAVDAADGKVYVSPVSDCCCDSIFRVDVVGGNYESLFDACFPSSIAVHPPTDLVCWSDYASEYGVFCGTAVVRHVRSRAGTRRPGPPGDGRAERQALLVAARCHSAVESRRLRH